MKTGIAILAAVAVCLGAGAQEMLRGGEDGAKAAYLEGWYQETAEGQPAKAIVAYRKAIDAKGDARLAGMALLRIGICLKALGKEGEARAAFEEVLAKHSAEGDLAARAKRFLSGKGDEGAAGLTVSDPRVEILSFLEDMQKSYETNNRAGDPTFPANPEDLGRFLTILRLATPEYVREVVLVKYPRFASQAEASIRYFQTPMGELTQAGRKMLPEADPVRLLAFTGIPELREPIFAYIGLKGDRSAAPHILPLLGSSDPGLRASAARALGKLEIQEAAPRILELLREEKARGPADDTFAEALGRLRCAGAVEEIARRSAAGEIGTSTAAGALGRIGSDAAIEVLKPLLLSKEDSAISTAWTSLDPPVEGGAAEKIIALGLDSEDPRHLYSALKLACQDSLLPQLPKIFPRIASGLERLAGAAGTEQIIDPGMGSPRSIAKARPGSKVRVRPDGYSREGSPRALASRILDHRWYGESAEKVAPLYRALSSTSLHESAVDFFSYQWEKLEEILDDPGLRLEAKVRRLQTLIQRQSINNGEPVSIFTAALGDPEPMVVLTALDEISRYAGKAGKAGPRSEIDSRIVDGVRRLIAPEGREGRPPAVREAALMTLAEMKDLQSCLPALEDPSPRTRLRAAELLKDLDAAHLQATGSGDLLVQRWLIGYLGSEGMSRLRSPWECLKVYFGSRFPEIRGRAADILANQKEVPREVGLPLARKALEDPSLMIPKEAAFRMLDSYEDWGPIIERWGEFAKLHLERAAEIAMHLKRLDLLRSLLTIESPEVRPEGIAAYLIETAEPEDRPAFLRDPLPVVRKAAVAKLAEEHDLKSLSRALADEDGEVARMAFDALVDFSSELQVGLASFGARKDGFGTIGTARRREIADSMGKWLEEQGKAIWIFRAEDERDSASATRALLAALPEPKAVEILVKGENIDLDLAVSGFAKLKMREPLLRMAEEMERHGIRDPKAYLKVLEGLLRAGEPAPRILDRIGDRLDRCDDLSGLILPSAEAGPEGPLPFLDLLKDRPKRSKEAAAIIEAFRNCRSGAGLRRAIAELPEPPLLAAYGALIDVGDPEPVLEEALRGAFWLDAAQALHDATGHWFDFFGPGLNPTGIQQRGFLTAGFMNMIDARNGSFMEKPLDPKDRQTAVAAWRKALEERRGKIPAWKKDG